jgi:hypothetical protein
LAAGIGVGGALLFYVAIGWVVLLGARACFKRPEDRLSGQGSENNREISGGGSSSRILFAGIVAACVAYNVHLFFGLSLPGASFLLWMFLGVLLVPNTQVVYVQPLRWAVPAALGASALLCVPGVFAMRLAAADRHFLEEKRYAEQDPARALEEIKKTTRLNPYLEIYLTDWVTLSAEQTVQAVGQKAGDAQQRIAETDALCKRLLRLSPWEYDSYLMVTSYYSGLGKVLGGAEGRAYLEKSAALAAEQIPKTPNGLALRYSYARTLDALGKREQAKKELQYCVDHDSDFEDAATDLALLSSSPTATL